jgi:glutaredoxin
MNNGVKIFWGVLIAVIVLGVGSTFFVTQPTSKLEGFAQCLKDKGVIMYGAYWCPHCQATKRMFGSAAKTLPYVECSTPDGQAQTQICKDKGIQSYPTWVFPDGETYSGEHTLTELASSSSCVLPQ